MTSPFSAARQLALKETLQSGKLALLKQGQDTPQFFCCISGNTVGVPKDPVPALEIADRVVCIGDDVTVDFSGSYSPTDTLADQPYTISWGDGSADTNGNFPNPRDPAAETATYVGGYSSVSFFNITLEVIDSLGVSSKTRLQVYARDCTLPANPLPFPMPPAYAHPLWWAEGAIVFSDDQAWYTTDIETPAPPGSTWTRVNDWANFTPTEIHDSMLKLESNGNEYIYVSDFAGIWAHPMPPWAGDWTLKKTAAEIVAAAGVSTATHTPVLQCLAMDFTHDGWQWVTWDASASGANPVDGVVGVAHTRDGWTTIYGSWEVTRVVYDAGKTQWCQIYGIDIDHHNPSMVYCVVGWADDLGVTDESRLYKSSSYGVSWAQIDTIAAFGLHGDVWVPWAGGGSYVYWATPDRLKRSAGGGFSTIWNPAFANYAATIRLSGPIDRVDICTGTYDQELWEYRNGANVHITPDFPGPGAGHASKIWVAARSAGSKYASNVIWVGSNAALTASYIRQNIGGIQNRKDNNWIDPYVTTIAWPELREYST